MYNKGFHTQRRGLIANTIRKLANNVGDSH